MLACCGVLALICPTASVHADDRTRTLWIDIGSGFTWSPLNAENANIDLAVFVRYRMKHWEIHGGAWHSDDEDVSNATVGGGYVFPLWRGLSFTGGLAVADKDVNVGTHLRFYLSGRYDFKCWSVGYVHYSNGMSTFNHDRGPNEGVDLIMGSRRLHC